MEMSTSHQTTTKKKRIQVDLAFVRSLLTEHLVGQALGTEHRLLLRQCEETEEKREKYSEDKHRIRDIQRLSINYVVYFPTQRKLILRPSLLFLFIL